MRAFKLFGLPAIPIVLVTPDIPESLRQRPAEWVAVARVHVERDGVSEVTMTEPSANTAIDAAILAALRQWRFRPTFIKGYLPIDSTVELRLTLAVK
jgi:TonB family protein